MIVSMTFIRSDTPAATSLLVQQTPATTKVPFQEMLQWDIQEGRDKQHIRLYRLDLEDKSDGHYIFRNHSKTMGIYEDFNELLEYSALD